MPGITVVFQLPCKMIVKFIRGIVKFALGVFKFTQLYHAERLSRSVVLTKLAMPLIILSFV